jgi:triacylglycerol lipase
MKTNIFYKVIIIGFLMYCLFCGSASAAEMLNSDPVQFDSLSLKYPVILVHGIAIRDQGFVVASWGRIPTILREYGLKVYLGNTDAWGSIESNAEIIKNTVDKVLEETKADKVNIIAHSKGGLDSRCFIWKYNYGDKVASLTTISTPHHGSLVADFIQNAKPLHTLAAKKSLEVLGKIYNDAYPNAYAVSYELTTGHLKEFNEIVTMDERVYYQSIYSTMNYATDDPIFASGFLYLKRVIGDNDGLVSEYSARWGRNIIKVQGGISHGQIIDVTGRTLFDIDITNGQPVDTTWRGRTDVGIPNIYLKIIKDLSDRGF